MLQRVLVREGVVGYLGSNQPCGRLMRMLLLRLPLLLLLRLQLRLRLRAAAAAPAPALVTLCCGELTWLVLVMSHVVVQNSSSLNTFDHAEAEKSQFNVVRARACVRTRSRRLLADP